MSQERPSFPQRDVAFPAGGRAGALLRATTWSATPLGPTSLWSTSLGAVVRMMLGTRQPTCIFWGPELVNLYNDGFIPLLGEKHPAAMGQPARECWADAWPVVGALLTGVIEKSEAFLFQEMLVPIVRHGKLEDAWWNYSYSPLFEENGAVAGVLVVATETTTEVAVRKQLEAAKHAADLAQQELEAVFMQAPLPMALLKGPDHRFSLVNGPYRALVGRDVCGKTLADAFTHEEVGYYRPFLDRVYESGEVVNLREAALRLPDAEGVVHDRFIDVGYQPYRSPSGDVIGVLALIHDVTLQVAARQREIELRRIAEAASGAKDEFLALVSHELRNPLNAILGWSQILGQSRDEARVGNGLSVIQRNAKAQAKLIDDILDVSRIASGKVVLELRRLRLSTVIKNAADSVRPAAEARGVKLVLELEAGSIDFVADENRLQQVVWNLLSNAVKFTGKDGEVHVAAVREGSQIAIRVTDTGQGIAAPFLPFVFDRFRQADASTTKHHGGLGLGLAIVRSLVELHGGSVSAWSEGVGRGARFEVLLPIRAVEPRVEAPSSQKEETLPAPAGGPTDRCLVGLRILVVDDEDDARELVAAVLQEAGAEVHAASSVAMAMDVLGSAPIELIVSDIGMPAEDGFTFIRRLRGDDGAHRRGIPALALSAYARDEDRRRALGAGFQEHVAKPIDPDILVQVVRGLARR